MHDVIAGKIGWSHLLFTEQTGQAASDDWYVKYFNLGCILELIESDADWQYISSIGNQTILNRPSSFSEVVDIG